MGCFSIFFFPSCVLSFSSSFHHIVECHVTYDERFLVALYMYECPVRTESAALFSPIVSNHVSSRACPPPPLSPGQETGRAGLAQLFEQSRQSRQMCIFCIFCIPSHPLRAASDARSSPSILDPRSPTPDTLDPTALLFTCVSYAAVFDVALQWSRAVRR